MTDDRLDEIRQRADNDWMGCPRTRVESDARDLLKEVDSLTHDIGAALDTITLEVEARVKAEAEVERLQKQAEYLNTQRERLSRLITPQEPRP